MIFKHCKNVTFVLGNKLGLALIRVHVRTSVRYPRECSIIDITHVDSQLTLEISACGGPTWVVRSQSSDGLWLGTTSTMLTHYYSLMQSDADWRKTRNSRF